VVFAIKKLTIVSPLARRVSVVAEARHCVCDPQSLVVVAIWKVVLAKPLSFAVDQSSDVVALVFISEFCGRYRRDLHHLVSLLEGLFELANV